MIAELAVAIPLAIACIAVSAFCSGTEVALFSIRRAEREQLAGGKRFLDRRIAELLEEPRRLIATVLVGNEACNSVLLVLAWLVLARWFELWEAFGLAFGGALLVVMITEVTAKTLAAKAPLAWSRLSVLPLAGFSLLVLPARLVVQGVTTLVLKPFGIAARARSPRDLSEEEFRTLVDAGSAQGEVDARERRLIHRVFEFNDKNVGQVMTPRERIFALSYDLPMQRLVKEVAARGFSRVPIYTGQKSLDNIRGILNAKDLVRTTAGQPLGRPLGELLHEPLFVPRTTPVKRLFLTFKQKKVHMAIVVSEYGKVLGLVTMDDLLSQIFGVLRDERAALQNLVAPPHRTASRTPAGVKLETGAMAVPTAAMAGAEETSVPVVDDGMVHRGDAAPAPDASSDEPSPGDPERDPRGDDSERSERDEAALAAARRSGASGVFGPMLRPVHVDDEVTPPATDIADLVAGGSIDAGGRQHDRADRDDEPARPSRRILRRRTLDPERYYDDDDDLRGSAAAAGDSVGVGDSAAAVVDGTATAADGSDSAGHSRGIKRSS